MLTASSMHAGFSRSSRFLTFMVRVYSLFMVSLYTHPCHMSSYVLTAVGYRSPDFLRHMGMLRLRVLACGASGILAGVFWAVFLGKEKGEAFAPPSSGCLSGFLLPC